MAGLPKKFAKLGFKKGWAAFRRSRGTSMKQKAKNLSRKAKTARKKYPGNIKKQARYVGGNRMKKTSKDFKLPLVDIKAIKDIGIPATYGYIRADISQRVVPFVRNLPGADKLGNVIDEAGMIAALGLIRKYVKNPMVREWATNGIKIEAAQIGQAARLGQLGIGQITTNVNNTGQTVF